MPSSEYYLKMELETGVWGPPACELEELVRVRKFTGIWRQLT